MLCSRLLLRLALSCFVLGAVLARPASAQAERPALPKALVADTTAADTTARDSSSLFDTRIATGHKPRRRGMRPAPRRSVPAPASTAPAASTAAVPVSQEAAVHVRTESSGEWASAVSDTTAPEPLAPEAEEAVQELEVAEPLVADLPAAPLAPEVEPATTPAAARPVRVPTLTQEDTPSAMVTPGMDAPAPEAAPGLFDSRIASGHKDLADVPPPTFFDSRIASGHKDLAERDDLMFDARVAEGHKVLPLPEPLAEYEAAIGVTAAGQFVVSPEGMDYVLSEAVRVGRLFNTSGKRRRAYFPMIETALVRRGLPLELKYLALIESSMDPLAVSHAGARGLWQIMPETAGDFGADSMAVHDPKVATTIAVQYLDRLHTMFDGDWLLAIAAYNSGPGRVQGFVRRFESAEGYTPSFWQIRSLLPRETRDYVPRFLAAIFYAQADV